MTLGYHYDPVELDTVAINVSNLNYVFPALPTIFIQEIGGELKNLAPSNTEDVSAKLQFGMTLGQEINDSSIPRIDIDAEVTESYMEGAFTNTGLTVGLSFDVYGYTVDLGSHSLVDYTATAKLDWSKGEVSQTLSGSFVDGLATFSGGYSFGTDYSHSWVFSAQLNFTDITPFIDGTTVLNWFLGKVYVNDDSLDNDYIGAFGQVNVARPWEDPEYVALGLRYVESTGFEFIWGDEIPITSSWYISESRNFVLLSSTWENEADGVEVCVTAPDGTVYYEEDFEANGI